MIYIVFDMCDDLCVDQIVLTTDVCSVVIVMLSMHFLSTISSDGLI